MIPVTAICGIRKWKSGSFDSKVGKTQDLTIPIAIVIYLSCRLFSFFISSQAKTLENFVQWVDQLKVHRLYRQHVLTYGNREAPLLRSPGSGEDDSPTTVPSTVSASTYLDLLIYCYQSNGCNILNIIIVLHFSLWKLGFPGNSRTTWFDINMICCTTEKALK